MSDQKVAIQFCPILRPTEKQFQNFYEYMQAMQAKYKDDYGMVKVIPPKGWKAHGQNYQALKKQMKVKKPIQQHAKIGKNDYYQIRNIIQQTMNFNRFEKRVADKSDIDEASPEVIQQKFWKTIKYTPPIYGADLHKSLMSSKAGTWNLGSLDSLLKDAAPVLIKGVTYPYCYVGTWKSVFCWHKQDLDLSSINYLHEGRQKFWYCIQTDDQDILQEQAKQAFPDNYAHCKNFMRHKTTLINPYRLKQKHPDLRITKAHQGPNEFMVAFCGSYHCGFNSGKNLAEAVNFATRDWLKKLQGVTYCQCTQRSVRPDYKYFIDNLQSRESRFRNDPSLRHLKSWVVSNGLYVESTMDEEVPQEKMHRKVTSKKVGLTRKYTQEQCSCDNRQKEKKIKKHQKPKSNKVNNNAKKSNRKQNLTIGKKKGKK